MKNIIQIILFLSIAVSCIYYFIYTHQNYGDVKLILLEKKEYHFSQKDKLPTRFIRDKDDMFYFAKEIFMTDTMYIEILDKLDLNNYDYIISCGYKIQGCNFSAEFTNNDGICKDEDPRIPLNLEYSNQTADTIYIYMIMCQKNKYRMPGP